MPWPRSSPTTRPRATGARGASVPGGAADDVAERALALARALDAGALDDVLRRAAATLGVAPFIETVAGAAAAARRRRVARGAAVARAGASRVVGAARHRRRHDARACPAPTAAPKLLVATPAGERHAIGAALVGAAAAVEGWHVVYLGADLPAAEIADAALASGARLSRSASCTSMRRERVLGELRTLRARLPADVTLLVGGGGARTLAGELATMDVVVESSIDGLVTELRRRRGGDA